MNPISTGGPVGGGNMGREQGSPAMSGAGARTAMGSGGMYVASSFGMASTTFEQGGFSAHSFINSYRVKMLGRRQSYFQCTNHDWKMFDFDGRMITPGNPLGQPLLATEAIGTYVALKTRRPHSPYRLARRIVSGFTSFLFGHGRWPTIRVHGDHMTEDWLNSIAKVVNLKTLMIRGRNLGGSVGTVGLSWRFYEGHPRVQVHNAKHVYVHEWEDREDLIPAHVSEIYTYEKDIFNREKKKFERKWYWYRRDWTPLADVVFKEVEYHKDHEPTWQVDEAATTVHKSGKCHFIWIQNLPEDDDTSIDGQPDYAELYEALDSLDILKSVVVRGATLNLDPTLILRLDPDIVSRTGGVKKGSDNSLLVGLTGDAKYMELGGSSITSGLALIEKMRDAVLESAQAILPDPNEIGGAGTSALALKAIYQPMLDKADVHRETYGEGIKRLLEQIWESGYARHGKMVDVPAMDDEGAPVVDEVGNQVLTQEQEVIILPPRVDEVPNPTTGEIEIVKTERTPGEGGEIELDWPDYFLPTADDKNKTVTTLQLAVTAKIMSQQSAAEEVAAMYERNTRAEWRRILEEAGKAMDGLGDAFADADGSMGGDVTDEGEEGEPELDLETEGETPPAPPAPEE